MQSRDFVVGKPRCRFIHQQDAGVKREGLRDLDFLALDGGQIPHKGVEIEIDFAKF